MTYQDDCALPVELLEQLTREGLEGLPELVRVLGNADRETELHWRSSVWAIAATAWASQRLQTEDRQDASGRNPLQHSPGA